MSSNVKYLEIWLADLPLIEGSHVQGGKRPVLIVSNDRANRTSPVVMAVPLTSRFKRLNILTHIKFEGRGLRGPSVALVEQLGVMDKSRLICKLGSLNSLDDCGRIKKAISEHLALAA